MAPGNKMARASHALSVAVIALMALAAPVSAETLREALEAAYKTNPRLDAERARLRVLDDEVARVKSGYRPTVSATADAGYQRVETKPQSPADGETHPKGYALNVTQPIFSGFRVLNGVREAEANVRAGRENLRIIEQNVLNEAVGAYMDVVRDQAILGLRENNVKVLSRELKATQDRFSVGEVTRTDVAQAEARRAVSISALELARSSLKTSQATFERVVGHRPGRLREQKLPEQLLPNSLQEAIAIGSKENPTVVQALYREQAARHNVDKVRGELLPTVRLEANYSHRYDPNKLVDEQETTSVTGRVSVPLYTAGEVDARVRQSKHTHVSRLQEVEQFRTEAEASIITFWSQLEAAKAQLVSDRVQVASTRTALAGVREEERVGQRTLLDVLNAENEALNAEVALVTTQRNLLTSAYNVISFVGRLNVAELGVTDQVYDPEVHYLEARRKWWGISITKPNGHRERHDFYESHGKQHDSMK